MSDDSEGANDGGLTIVLPTIRIDSWLRLAVESVLSQITEAELVVVHDGVLPDPNEWWVHDRRVVIRYSPARLGLVTQLRRAIEASRRPLIARLDADDMAMPGRFDAQIAYFHNNPRTVLLAGEAVKIDTRGRLLGKFGAASGPDIRGQMLQRNRIVHSSVMFRRDAYNRAGGFDVTLPQMEDYELWMRMGLEGAIAALGEPLVWYRLHDAQVSRGAKPFGHSVRAVRQARWQLGRALGFGAPALLHSAITWEGAQWLRYLGARRPGYDQELAE